MSLSSTRTTGSAWRSTGPAGGAQIAAVALGLVGVALARVTGVSLVVGGMGAVIGSTLLFRELWPVHHGVIELYATGGRLFHGGAWHRFRWDEIRAVYLLDGVVLEIALGTRSFRMPVGHTLPAARFVMGVLKRGMAEPHAAVAIPAALTQLARSAGARET